MMSEGGPSWPVSAPGHPEEAREEHPHRARQPAQGRCNGVAAGYTQANMVREPLLVAVGEQFHVQIIEDIQHWPSCQALPAS